MRTGFPATNDATAIVVQRFDNVIRVVFGQAIANRLGFALKLYSGDDFWLQPWHPNVVPGTFIHDGLLFRTPRAKPDTAGVLPT